jgi:hypothetical protein
MSPGRRVVEEYTALLSRAFNGAIEVVGQRIVAHPSGTLLARSARGTMAPAVAPVMVLDRDNDWSSV